MPRHGLELKARSDLLVAGVRGTRLRIAWVRLDDAHGLVAPVIPLVARVPHVDYPPTTRTIVEKGIVSVRLRGRILLELLYWSPGVLTASQDGA